MSDYDLWVKWIRCSSGGAGKSWSMWWNEENAFFKGMPVVSKLVFMIKSALFLLVAEGIRRSNLFRSDASLSTPMVAVGNVLIFIAVLLILERIFVASERNFSYPIRRTIGIMLFCGIIIGVITLFMEDTNFIRYALSAYYGLGAFCQVGLLFGFKIVKHFYMIHDIICGHIIFVPLFLLAALQLPRLLQTWLLYHNALSADVVVSDILRYAHKTRESGGSSENSEDLMEQLSDLKRIVQKQEQILTNAGLLGVTDESGVTSGSDRSFMPPAQYRPSVPPPVPGYGGRALSLSGLDVWGTMALGDTKSDEDQQPLQPLSTGSGFSFSQPDTMPPR
jgi:callose synthase